MAANVMTENFTGSTAAGRDGTRIERGGCRGTNEAAAAQRREAARALETIPILTAAKHPGELALIRRHAPALKHPSRRCSATRSSSRPASPA